jgi:hypothetical protein
MFVLKGMRVVPMNTVKTSIMKDVIFLFSFRSAVSKKIPDVTVIHFLYFCCPILLTLHWHRECCVSVSNNKYVKNSMGILQTIICFLGTKFQTFAEVGAN